MVNLTLKGNPLSTNHIYRHNGKFVYMTKEGKALKESYQWQAKSQYKGKPIDKEIDVRIELFFGDQRKRDIDNYGKILLDSLSGIVWDDDKQIVSMLIIKNIDKKDPRIELEVAF